MRIRSIDGRPVIDARRDLELEIAPRDCRNGDSKDPASCAVAHAARREVNAHDVRIHLSRVYIRTNEGNWQRYTTSAPLQKEIIVFDRGGEMMPGKYMLLAPKKSQRIGFYAGGKKRGKRGGTRRAAHPTSNVRIGPAGGDS